MAKISFGSPWMAALGGTAQGISAGFEDNQMAQNQKLQREQMAQQSKQQEVGNFAKLMEVGVKISDSNPEMLPQFIGMVNQKYGYNLQVSPAISAIERFKAARAEAIAAGMTPEQADNWAFQKGRMTPPKGGKEAEQHFMMTPQGPVPVAPGKYHNMPSTMIPQTYFNAQDPSQQFQMPPSSHPLPQQPAWQVPSTTETEADLSPGDLKKFDALEAKYNATQDPKEREVIEKQIRDAGGSIEKIKQEPGMWGYGAAKPDKGMIVPPSTKKKTSVKTPGLGGVPEPGGVDAGAVKAKAKELIQKGKDPAKVKAWAASKGVILQ